MSIEIRSLNKAFGKTVVCDNLNLDIPSGELVALLGPSGSGRKSRPPGPRSPENSRAMGPSSVSTVTSIEAEPRIWPASQ